MNDEERALKELLIATLMESDEVIDAMESYDTTLHAMADRLSRVSEMDIPEVFVAAYVDYTARFTEVCRIVLTA